MYIYVYIYIYMCLMFIWASFATVHFIGPDPSPFGQAAKP